MNGDKKLQLAAEYQLAIMRKNSTSKFQVIMQITLCSVYLIAITGLFIAHEIKIYQQ